MEWTRPASSSPEGVFTVTARPPKPPAWSLLGAYILILFLGPLVTAQHVVYMEIGRFAGATSYIHMAVHLDLQDLKTLLDAYADQIEAVRQQMSDYDLSLLQVKGYRLTDVLEDLIQRHKEAHNQILNLAERKMHQFQADLE